MPGGVDHDRFVLRRAHIKQRGTRGVFTPGVEDDDGLSVYLESESVTPESVLERARRPPEEYTVLRIRVADLNELGLTVISDEDESDPGHCIIPELSRGSYESDKRRWKPIQQKLLQIAEELT